MSYFKHHVFICTNQREGGEQCCNNVGGSDMFAYAKDRIGAMKLNGPGAVRVMEFPQVALDQVGIEAEVLDPDERLVRPQISAQGIERLGQGLPPPLLVRLGPQISQQRVPGHPPVFGHGQQVGHQ